MIAAVLFLLIAHSQEIPVLPKEVNNCKSAWIYQDINPTGPYVDPRVHFSDYVNRSEVVPDAAEDRPVPPPNSPPLLTPQNLCDRLKDKKNAEGGWNIISAEPTGSFSDQENWIFRPQRRYLCRLTRARELKLGPIEVATRPGGLTRNVRFEAPATSGPVTCLTCDHVAKGDRPRCLAKVIRGLIVNRPSGTPAAERSTEISSPISVDLKRYLARQVCHYLQYAQDVDLEVDTEFDLPAYSDLFKITKTPCDPIDPEFSNSLPR